MRSIIKTRSCDPKTDPESETKAKQLKFSSDSKSREKKVRFDDMQTLGLGCGDLEADWQFLNQEETSIIEKKATPTKFNMAARMKPRAPK